MSYPYSPGPRPGPASPALTQPWAPRADRRPIRATPLTRRYEMSWLTPDGVESGTRIAPAAAPFEEAFAAFARGTLIATEDGPVAVEDLVPGQQIVTADGASETLLWVGSMTLFPKSSAEVEPARLIRLTARCRTSFWDRTRVCFCPARGFDPASGWRPPSPPPAPWPTASR